MKLILTQTRVRGGIIEVGGIKAAVSTLCRWIGRAATRREIDAAFSGLISRKDIHRCKDGFILSA